MDSIINKLIFGISSLVSRASRAPRDEMKDAFVSVRCEPSYGVKVADTAGLQVTVVVPFFPP